jgi:hypothetical protein
MKIKASRFDLIDILTYPIFFNISLIIILLSLGTFNILFGWMHIKCVGKYTVLYINKKKYFETLRDVISAWLLLFINSWYWNINYSRFLVDYLMFVLWPYYEKDSDLYNRELNDFCTSMINRKNIRKNK